MLFGNPQTSPICASHSDTSMPSFRRHAKTEASLSIPHWKAFGGIGRLLRDLVLDLLYVGCGERQNNSWEDFATVCVLFSESDQQCVDRETVLVES